MSRVIMTQREICTVATDYLQHRIEEASISARQQRRALWKIQDRGYGDHPRYFLESTKLLDLIKNWSDLVDELELMRANVR